MSKISYYKIIIVLLLAQVLAKSQNLVLNNFFEIYSSCPNSNNPVNLAVGWDVVKGTPDYDNSCSTYFISTVPNFYSGYQQDCCGGRGYAGIYTAQSVNDDREFMQTKLSDTLKAGHKYLASMYVNCANRMNYAIATLGMLFTDTAIVLPNYDPSFTPTPQVRNNTLLADTFNWILIQDTIVSIGNEVYLTIGNFNLDATSDTVKLKTSGVNGSYYYIDNVSVIDVATLGIEQIKEKIKIDVYPNPATDKLYIETKEEDVKEIRLYDVLGKEQLSTTKKEIDVSTIPNGIYILHVKINEGVLIKKVVVQH